MVDGRKMDTVLRWSPLDIPTIVRAHWNAKPKEPFQLIGEPSTVKSAMIYQEAKRLAEESKRFFLDWNRSPYEAKQDAVVNPANYFVFADLRASETDIGELRLQDMNREQPYITFKYNVLFGALSGESAMGILFLDEMNLAPNMIKAQFYKIINDRCIGDIPLADGVLVVSAGNESEHARGVTEDPVPLVLRRGNYFIRPLTDEEFSEYAVRTEHHPLVVGYLGFQPQDVHQIRYDVPESVGQPCARTWTKLSNILKANRFGEEDTVKMIATGLVGQAAATKFYAYVKSARKVDIDSILRNPELIKEYEKNPEDLSLIYALITGVVERFRHEPKVIRPAFEVSLFISRVELGTYMLRSLRAVNEKSFKKCAVDNDIVPPELMNRMVERYAKFLWDKRQRE